MNDYWNDPPESPEPPSCPNNKPDAPVCEGLGEYLRDDKKGITFKCDTCGDEWTVPVQQDPEPMVNFPVQIDHLSIAPKKCPHGNEWHECNACMEASDRAYDAQREARR